MELTVTLERPEARSVLFGPADAHLRTIRETLGVQMFARSGVVKITAETCTVCHNEKSPTYDESKKLDFKAMKEKGAHQMRELKFREG